MIKNYPFRKAKGIFVYDIQSNRYYDLQKNSNIIGHSNKKITTIVKNHISSSWNLYGDTIYHRKIKALYDKLFSSNYHLAVSFSLIEFFTRFFNYTQQKSSNLQIIGDRFNLWIKKHCNNINREAKNDCKTTIIYDMAELFFKSNGDIKQFNKTIADLKKEEITIFNYYWYPYLDIITNNADIIILPQIYSGHFEYINILINKKINDFNYYTFQLNNIPSLYLASSLKLYYTIKKISNYDSFKLNWNGFIQAGRLFVSEELNSQKYKEIVNKYLEKKILLNLTPPYYSYLPIIVEDYQKKYLSRIKI